MAEAWQVVLLVIGYGLVTGFAYGCTRAVIDEIRKA